MTDPRRADENGRDEPYLRRSRLYRILQVFCRVLTTMLFDFKVFGAKNIPKNGGVLVIANHQSYLDPVILAVKLDRPVCYLAKSELFHHRFADWLIRRLNGFPIKQGAGDVGAMKEAIRRLKDGHVLAIFPEGSRSPDGELQDVQPGIALVIRRADVPVIPAVIDGAFRAWPRHKKMIRAHPIRIAYGKPMTLRGLEPAQITARISETFKEMLMELRSKHKELQ